MNVCPDKTILQLHSFCRETGTDKISISIFINFFFFDIQMKWWWWWRGVHSQSAERWMKEELIYMWVTTMQRRTKGQLHLHSHHVACAAIKHRSKCSEEEVKRLKKKKCRCGISDSRTCSVGRFFLFTPRERDIHQVCRRKGHTMKRWTVTKHSNLNSLNNPINSLEIVKPFCSACSSSKTIVCLP